MPTTFSHLSHVVRESVQFILNLYIKKQNVSINQKQKSHRFILIYYNKFFKRKLTYNLCILILLTNKISIFLFSVEKCPLDWVKSGEFCYLKIKETLSWQNASNECKKKGGNLASIHTMEENDFIWSKSLLILSTDGKRLK